MKKHVAALALVASVYPVGHVAAQSSTEVFGFAKLGFTAGQGSVMDRTALSSMASRFGIRGGEDLGGGLGASFWLEAGFNLDDGYASNTNTNNQANGAILGQGASFGRRAVVGLESSIGQLLVGRDGTPHSGGSQEWGHPDYDPYFHLGVGNSRAGVGSAGGYASTRASNSLGYISPNFDGIRLQLQTYLGENPHPAPNAGSGNSVLLAYDKNPLSLGAAYGKTTTGAGTNVKTTNIGGSFDIGAAKLMGYVRKDANTSMPDVDGFVFGTRIRIGTAGGELRASLSQTEKLNAKTRQFAIGYWQHMSKRTALFSTWARVGNSGGAAAALNNSVTGANQSSRGYDLGLQHSF